MAFANVQSFADMILRRVEETPERVAFMYPTDPGWATMTWRQAGERVRALASGLRALGLQNEDRCSLLGATSLDWILCDYAVMCAAGATTTIYPSNTPDECAYIINDSASKIAFVENDLSFALEHCFVLTPEAFAAVICARTVMPFDLERGAALHRGPCRGRDDGDPARENDVRLSGRGPVDREHVEHAIDLQRPRIVE